MSQVDSPPLACPNSQELRALVRGDLPVKQATEWLNHLTECSACRERLGQNEVAAAELDERGAARSRETIGETPAANNSPVRATDEFAAMSGRDAAAANLRRQQALWAAILAPPLEPQELGCLGGYRILRVLGEGGMGVVFEAKDIRLGRHVAIKLLRPGDFDESVQQRFLQEAQLAASIQSDHVVTIYQVGEDRDCAFIVMELLRGETVETRMASERQLPVDEVLRITREVAAGLASVHDKNLIHRDIKPANVWLETRRHGETAARAKLLDFGVARHLGGEQNLTLAGRAIGTPACMSPEQARGESLDQRSDLFSLGCLMYAMLSGHLPFDRGSLIKSIHAVLDEQPRPVAELAAGVPPQLSRLIERLLQKKPKDRPQSAAQVIREIQAIEQSLPIAMAPVARANQTTLQLAVQRARRKLGWEVWAGGLAILLAMLVGLWAEYRRVVRHESSDAVAASVVSVPPEDGAIAGAAAGLAADDGDADAVRVINESLPPIKVGIIHSLTGPMAASERPIVDAFLLGVEEINQQGGLLNGRRIQPIVRDGKSNETVFARQAEELITREGVSVLFGCWRSPCRKLVEEVCRRHEHLLIYPTTYEGLEQSPYVIYLGGAPNQQVIPAIKWAFAFLGKRKFYLIGADGVYSQSIHQIIRDELESLGGEVVGEGHRPLGDSTFTEIAEDIVRTKADVVINTAIGAGINSLFYQLRKAGVTAPDVPTISVKLGEDELQDISAFDSDLVGDYVVAGYFQSLTNQDNVDFIERFRAHYGPTRVTSDAINLAYAGVYLWARAVEEAQSDNVVKVREAIVNQTFEAPEGELTIDAETRHARRRALIGQVNADRQVDVVWTSPQPIAPVPFPDSRSREDWQDFQHELYESWGGHWRSEDAVPPDERSEEALPEAEGSQS